MKLNSLTLARMLQNAIKRRKSSGYSHPPVEDLPRCASFSMTTEGRKFIVTVFELSLEEELERIK
jgi:hypothetical protein